MCKGFSHDLLDESEWPREIFERLTLGRDTRPYRKSNPDIMVVQSAQDRQAENTANRQIGAARTTRIGKSWALLSRAVAREIEQPIRQLAVPADLFGELDNAVAARQVLGNAANEIILKAIGD